MPISPMAVISFLCWLMNWSSASMSIGVFWRGRPESPSAKPKASMG